MDNDKKNEINSNGSNEIAVFGGGCFWCTEAVFKMLKGIISIIPGYTGGTVESPTYEQVSTGTTGHVEATRIEFDPSQIRFRDLMTVFFASHDPTSIDKQGNDVGPQYRSVIFYSSEEQKQEAEQMIKELDASYPAGKPIVTKLLPLGIFWEAENYHHDYYEHHKDEPYCQLIINPKLEKVQKEFADLLKRNEK